MDFFLISLFLNILIGELLPHPKPPSPHRYTLGEFSVPTATEDRAQAIPFGTVQLAGNIIWYGDLKADAVQHSVRTGLFSHDTVTDGYRYRMGMWMTLAGITCDELQEIRMGDKVVWKGNLTLNKHGTTTLDVNARWDESEGQAISNGIVGRFVFFNRSSLGTGVSVDLNDPYLNAVLGGNDNVPSYPDCLHVVWYGPSGTGILQNTGFGPNNTVGQEANTAVIGKFDGDTTGMCGFVAVSPSISPMTFTVKRLPNLGNVSSELGQYIDPSYSDVSGDANPALVQLEVLTTRAPGLGPRLNAFSIDVDSFLAAAKRYKAEGLGMSYSWEVSRPVGDLLGDISLMTASVLEIDERTGRLRTRLLRAGDTPVMAFDETNLIAINSFTRSTMEQAPNRVSVPFVDRQAGMASRVAYAKNTAAAGLAGTVIDQRTEFIGTSRESQALILATRELAKVSSPLAKASFTGWLPVGMVLKPGDLITLKHPQLGQVTHMRISSAKFGSPGNMLRVEIDAVEDVFRGGYSFDTGSTPIAIGGNRDAPSPLLNPTAMLAPFALTGEFCEHVLYFGDDPGTGVNTYRMAEQEAATWTTGGTTSGQTFYSSNTQEPAVSGTLAVTLGSTDAQPTLQIALTAAGVEQWGRSGRGQLFVIVENEWMQCSDWSLSGNTLTAGTVERAIFDSVPAYHTQGTKVRILLGYFITEQRVRSKLLPYATPYVTFRAESTGSLGVLSADNAAGSQVTWNYDPANPVRAARALSPANVLLGGMPPSFSLTEDATSTVRLDKYATLSFCRRDASARMTAGWFTASDMPLGFTTYVQLEYQSAPGVWVDVTGQVSVLGNSVQLPLQNSDQNSNKNVIAGSKLRVTMSQQGPWGNSEPLVMYWNT